MKAVRTFSALVLSAILSAVSAFADAHESKRQSMYARHSFTDGGKAIEFDVGETASMCGTHYAVVCFDAASGTSIEEVTPRYRRLCGRLVRREVLDSGTWGFVFELSKSQMPFVVWGSTAKFKGKGAAFWMEKRR